MSTTTITAETLETLITGYQRAVEALQAAWAEHQDYEVPAVEEANDAACEAGDALTDALDQLGYRISDLGQDGQWDLRVNDIEVILWETDHRPRPVRCDREALERIVAEAPVSMSNTERTTIVAEVTTVEMPEGQAFVSLFRVPDNRLDDTTHEWERAGFWLDAETVAVEDSGLTAAEVGLTVEEVEGIVGRMLGVSSDEVRMDLWHDVDGDTRYYRGRVLP